MSMTPPMAFGLAQIPSTEMFVFRNCSTRKHSKEALDKEVEQEERLKELTDIYDKQLRKLF